jgi:hypothetical protein
MTDRAAGGGTRHAVVDHVAGETADHSTLETALGLSLSEASDSGQGKNGSDG